jgi:hypothetical protein
VGDNVVDLDAPLATSAGYPIDTKKDKVAVTMEVPSEMVQTSINKWKAEVATQSIIRAQNANDRCVSMLEKQGKKIKLDVSRVAMKKRKEDFNDVDRRHIEHG